MQIIIVYHSQSRCWKLRHTIQYRWNRHRNGSGTGGNGGGEIIVTPLPSPPQKETTVTTTSSNILDNLDLNSFLLPGIVLLAAYFFIKK